jgi:HPt (histidine-containing phosphotransfer) domain-containing protein
LSDLARQIVAGLEELGALAMSLEMAAIQGTLPDDVKQQLASLASDMAQKIDALRALARAVP